MFKIDRSVTVQSYAACRFKKRGKKWYNWSDQEAQDQWDRAVRDPAVPKSTDVFGFMTVAKLGEKTLSAGCRVGTQRELAEHRPLDVNDDPSELRQARQRTDLRYYSLALLQALALTLWSCNSPTIQSISYWSMEFLNSKAAKGMLDSRFDVETGAGEMLSQGLSFSSFGDPVDFKSFGNIRSQLSGEQAFDWWCVGSGCQEKGKKRY